MAADPIGTAGDLISAGLKFYGAQQDRKAAEAANALSAKNALEDRALQMKFAEEGIRMKVHDAKEAGINPLYALGASTVSYSPVSVGQSAPSGMADALGSMGQDISRAAHATRTTEERQDAFDDTVKKVQLEGAQLDNDIKRANLASSIQRLKANANPPMASTNPANKGLVDETDPSERKRQYIGGTQIKTDPNTTSMQDFEDRYGDEGLPTWLIPPFIMWQDFKANVGEASKTPRPGVRQGSLLDRYLNSRGRR